jgi:hypothetical protein
MMDKKRIRKTLNDVVERYLLGDVDGDFRFNYIWVRAQLSFAFSLMQLRLMSLMLCLPLSFTLIKLTGGVQNAQTFQGSHRAGTK